MAWITDGSGGFVVNGNVVTLRDNVKVDNVFNAMWQEGDGVSSGEHYWKIHFTSLENDGAGVGLTSKNHFKKGYACNAIEYSGNLSNGCGRLVGSFGPAPKEGDVIGIFAVFESDRLKVYIDVNGASLGLAFDVPASTFKSIYPIVSFKKSGSATCTKQTVIPNIIRAPTTFTGIEGDWKLTQFTNNGIRLTPHPYKTKISKKASEKYSWIVTVVNQMWTELSNVDGNWKTSGICSTLMDSDDESMQFENTVSSLMKQIKVIEVDGSGNLIVNSDTTSSIWTRYDATPSAFVGAPSF